jgi:23S rRNA pseudouridine1911/1915/1917 synthase
VQGDETGDIPLVELCKDYLKEKYKKPGNVFLGVVHRIDRPVSGVVVLAKTSKSLERMNKLFQTKEINKIYWALVKNKPAKQEDTLIHWLKKDGRKNFTTAYHKEVLDSKRSELKYEVMKQVGEFFLLQVRPLTGRPHQIRVQLSTIGSPIKGDVKYGFPSSNHDGSINLHARSINFKHPVTHEEITVSAELPSSWGLESVRKF